MAARLFLRPRVAPAATGAIIAAVALYPASLFAESPSEPKSRKPIYDELEAFPAASEKPSLSPGASPSPRKRTSPTPTDKLAAQIGKTRLFLHAHVAAAENKVNELVDNIFDLETSFTSTIASLAPAPQTGEKLMPGSLYVLVAAMTGSIVSRNRNIVLRGFVPLAVGIGAGWIVLPHTMRNVSDLLWKYEQRFPAVADGHLRTRENIERVWRTARAHTQQAVSVVDDKVSSGREAVEGWVKKGN